MIRTLRLLVLTATALALPVAPASANAIDLTAFDAFVGSGTPYDYGNHPQPQAGAHEDFTTSFSFCDPNTAVPCTGVDGVSGQRGEDVRYVTVSAPPGLLGNSKATPFCENSDYVADNCPLSSKIGVSNTYVLVQGGLLSGVVVPLSNQPVYNVRPQGAEFGRLGSIATLDNVNKNYLPTLVTVRTATDYGLDNIVLDLPQLGITGVDSGPVPIKIRRIDLTLCGYVGVGAGGKCGDNPISKRPFMNSPTNCENHTVTMKAASWEDPTNFSSITHDLSAADCANVPFSPTIDVNNDNSVPGGDQTAGKPSAFDVGLDVPADTPSAPRRQSHVRRSTTILPPGVRLNPGAARHIDKCTDAQFGYGTDNSVACPPASEIGDVTIDSDAIDGDPQTDPLDPLEGHIYFAEPTADKPWRVFATAEGGGLRQKLIGETTLDQTTGRITTVFDNNPQLPFTRFGLRFRGGAEGILLNPEACGTGQADQSTEPWSGQADAPSSDTINVSFDGAGAPCPASIPFQPSLTVSTDTQQAGAASKLHVGITRPDGDQQLRSIAMTLPAGLIGRLTGTQQCATAQADAGDCPAASRIGHLSASIGVAAASSIDFPGSVYLAEPLVAGDPASLAFVVPARTGPIDLGNEVIRARVGFRQDGGLNVLADQVPTIFKGVPTPIRSISIDIDKPGFIRNPSGCDQRSISASFGGHAAYGADADATASSSFQATGCDQLGFSPRIKFFTGGEGQTGNESHPPLRTVLTMDDGQAALARTVVRLPDVFRPDTTNINKPGALCQRPEGNLPACPDRSRIGSASVTSPLLPDPLTGPVYAIQTEPGKLPKLGVLLRGAVTLELYGQSSLDGVRTVTDFSSTPDLPLTRFEMAIDGGPNGILKTRGSLCSGRPAADIQFSGFNGASVSQQSVLDVAGCSRLAIPKTTLKVSRGTVAVPLSCEQGSCKGTLSLSGKPAGKSRRAKRSAKAVSFGSRGFALREAQKGSVSIKLSKSAKRLVSRSKRITITASADTPDGVVSQTMTLKGKSKASKRAKKRR